MLGPRTRRRISQRRDGLLGNRRNQEGFKGVPRGYGHPVCPASSELPSSFRRAVPAFVLCLLLLPLAVACDSIDKFVGEQTSRSTAVSPASTTGAAASPTPVILPTATTAPSASGLILPVAIAAVPDSLPKYDRGTWRHWVDEDRDCQNARQEVLIAESITPVTYEPGDQCRVAAGSWRGPYTGKAVNSPSELDIDHLVPLENAHRSGGWAWDRERKRDYANYLGYDDHLIATTSSANRSKGSKGPEAWRPELESYWCSYATSWVKVKNEWGLTVTQDEYAALAEMLSTCDTPVLLEPTSGAPTPMPTATAAPTLPSGLRYDPFGPDRNCSDFDSYEEALAFFLASGGPETDRHRLDDDRDGEPCETLPGGPSARASPEGSGDTTALYAVPSTPKPPGARDCPAPPPTGIPASLSGFPPRPAPESSNCLQTPYPSPAATPFPAATPASTLTPTPTPTPQPTPSAEETFQDRDCGEFPNWREAQGFFLSEGGPADDPHELDRDGDGVACSSLSGAPASQRKPPTPTPTQAPTPTPQAEPLATEVAPTFAGLPFDPNGPDRNCGDFASWWDAQNFFLAAGGPDEDPHRLDRNGDGIVCESLDGAPGVPKEDSPTPDSTPGPPVGGDNDFVDRNCSDFGTWREAQDFFEAEGGPAEDPHGLDHNGDGIVCESLQGSPSEDPGEEFVDRNCSDFGTWREAQDFFEAEGGPAEDPHGLDRDGDGVACESLPGSP